MKINRQNLAACVFAACLCGMPQAFAQKKLNVVGRISKADVQGDSQQTDSAQGQLNVQADRFSKSANDPNLHKSIVNRGTETGYISPTNQEYPDVQRTDYSTPQKPKYIKCSEKVFGDVCPTVTNEKPRTVQAQEYMPYKCRGRYSLAGNFYCE